jgi:hypothetical protein
MNNPNAYCLDLQRTSKGKETGLREKGLAQPHYSIQNIEGFALLCDKEKVYIPQSWRKEAKSTVLLS